MPLTISHYNFPCRTMKNLKIFLDFCLLISYLSNRCWCYPFPYHCRHCELMLHKYGLSSSNDRVQTRCLGNGVELDVPLPLAILQTPERYSEDTVDQARFHCSGFFNKIA